MKVRTFLILAMVIASCGATCWLGVTSGIGDRAPRPALLVVDGLGIEEAALDLGEAWAGQDFAPSVTIHNRRSGPVEITGFVTSCGRCSSVEPPSVVIPTGGTASICLHLKPGPAVAAGSRPGFPPFLPGHAAGGQGGLVALGRGLRFV